ncbi:hypothetical protein Tco_1501959 [Tanacetum coccineum]
MRNNYTTKTWEFGCIGYSLLKSGDIIFMGRKVLSKLDLTRVSTKLLDAQAKLSKDLKAPTDCRTSENPQIFTSTTEIPEWKMGKKTLDLSQSAKSSNRDGRLTSPLWQAFSEALGQDRHEYGFTTLRPDDQKRAYESRERSSRMLLMIIKISISVAIRGAIPDFENAKEFLSSVEKQFKGTSKAHASTLILKMLTTKYDGVSGVREHIMMMRDMANKLKGVDMEISEGFLVHFIMTSLPMQFDPFKINYNTQKEKWKMS